MGKYRVVAMREENETERTRREWFAQRLVGSPETIEATARLLVGLSTTLLGLLFTGLTVGEHPLPTALATPVVRILSASEVILLLLSLLFGLAVLFPLPHPYTPGMPAEEERTFRALVNEKARWLRWCAALFALGLVVLAALLLSAQLWR